MYLDNDLASADRETIERHLRDCPCCDEVFESLKHTVVVCHEAGRPELPDDVRLRAQARVAELLQRSKGKRRPARPQST